MKIAPLDVLYLEMFDAKTILSLIANFPNNLLKKYLKFISSFIKLIDVKVF